MRRIALLAACLIASAVLMLMLVPTRTSAAAMPAAGLNKGALHDNGVVLVRRGGFRGYGFRGRGFGGGRAYGWRGGPRYGWGGRRGWRGAGWGLALGTAALATAPYHYGGYRCPMVRRTVWTPYGYRARWVRRC